MAFEFVQDFVLTDVGDDDRSVRATGNEQRSLRESGG